MTDDLPKMKNMESELEDAAIREREQRRNAEERKRLRARIAIAALMETIHTYPQHLEEAEMRTISAENAVRQADALLLALDRPEVPPNAMPRRWIDPKYAPKGKQ